MAWVIETHGHQGRVSEPQVAPPIRKDGQPPRGERFGQEKTSPAVFLTEGKSELMKGRNQALRVARI